MMTVRDALEVSAEMYRKDSSNVPDYVQRHLYSLSLWDELRYELFVDLIFSLLCNSLKHYELMVFCYFFKLYYLPFLPIMRKNYMNLNHGKKNAISLMCSIRREHAERLLYRFLVLT